VHQTRCFAIEEFLIEHVPGKDGGAETIQNHKLMPASNLVPMIIIPYVMRAMMATY
jgi:hypothetical protein